MADDDKIRLRRALADLLRAKRLALGISQEELGVRSGIAQANISMLERGAMFPSIARLIVLARLLSIDIGELAALEQEHEPTGSGRAA